MQEYRIYVADRDPITRRNLKEILTRNGHVVVGDAADGTTAMKQIRDVQPDLVITNANLLGVSGYELASVLSEDRVSAILLIADYARGMDTREKVDGGIPIISWPLDEHNLMYLVDYAIFNYQRLLQLEKDVERLKGELENRKTVEKAKGILMKTQGLSEEEAFKKMQLKSMNNRTTMKKIAEAIILTYEMTQ